MAYRCRTTVLESRLQIPVHRNRVLAGFERDREYDEWFRYRLNGRLILLLAFVVRAIEIHRRDRSAHNFLTSKSVYHDSAFLADETLSTNGEPGAGSSQLSDADRFVIDLGDDRESRI